MSPSNIICPSLVSCSNLSGTVIVFLLGDIFSSEALLIFLDNSFIALFCLGLVLATDIESGLFENLTLLFDACSMSEYFGASYTHPFVNTVGLRT